MRRILTPPKGDESALVASARSGDRVAFGLLYRRYARMVHGILLCRVRPQDSDDLLQDVFMRALRQLPELRNADAFGPWLAAIARNCARDHHRRAEETSPLREDLGAQAAAAESPAQLLRFIVRALPEAYRETIVLRLVEGMTGPEIAERTGLTPASVRVNLCRGMKLLREKMEATDAR